MPHALQAVAHASGDDALLAHVFVDAPYNRTGLTLLGLDAVKVCACMHACPTRSFLAPPAACMQPDGVVNVRLMMPCHCHQNAELHGCSLHACIR